MIHIFSMNVHACRNAIVNSTNAKFIRLRVNERVRDGAYGITVYAPNGDDTTLSLFSDVARDSFRDAVIYANNTSKIEFFGNGNYRFHGITLYAYNANSIYIDCHNTDDSRQCNDMKIYIHSQTFNISDPYPKNRLYVDCRKSNACQDTQLFISSNNNPIYSCIFTYNSTLAKWFCGSDEVTYATNIPTPSPTNKPTPVTITPTTSPTQLTANPTAFPTYTPTYSPTKLTPTPTITTDKPFFVIVFTPKHLPWVISGILIILMLIVLCLFCCIYMKNKRSQIESGVVDAHKFSIQTNSTHMSRPSTVNNMSEGVVAYPTHVPNRNTTLTIPQGLPKLPLSPENNGNNINDNNVIKYNDNNEYNENNEYIIQYRDEPYPTIGNNVQ